MFKKVKVSLMLKIVVMVFCLAAVTTYPALSADNHIITKPLEENQSITTHVNEIFKKSLISKPSTGYKWICLMPCNTNILVQTDNYKESPIKIYKTPPIVGGDLLRQTFEFEAKGKGTTTIEFILARPWDHNDYSKKITLTVVIE